MCWTASIRYTSWLERWHCCKQRQRRKVSEWRARRSFIQYEYVFLAIQRLTVVDLLVYKGFSWASRPLGTMWLLRHPNRLAEVFHPNPIIPVANPRTPMMKLRKEAAQLRRMRRLQIHLRHQRTLRQDGG
jgi:hypothetical protein